MWATDAAATPRARAPPASSPSSSSPSARGDVAFDLLFPRRPGGARRAGGASNSSSTSSGLPPAFSKEELWTFSPAESAAMAASSASSTSSSTASSAALDELSDARSGAAAAPAASAASSSHGVIGSSSARLVWNRVAPEEEEREEEALPSYLSYASAPAFAFPSDRFLGFGARTSAVPASSTASLSAFPIAFSDGVGAGGGGSSSVTASSTTTGAHVEEKTKELAQALQEFILAQVATPAPPSHGHHAHPSAAGGTNGNCECGPLRTRVNELEGVVKAMQAQMERLLPSNDDGGANGDQQQSGAGSTVISDRISTLEGRQSAFQSQLAQISRVLGVPVGKHGKNSPLKTLVQSLHDAIDQKVAEAEAAATSRVMERVEALVETSRVASKAKDTVNQADDEQEDGEEQQQGEHAAASDASSSSSLATSNSSTSLPMEAVLSVLAQEHETSMAKLSGALEERMLHESKQRVALEARVHARLAQQEEWLLQLEREVSGTRYDGATACSCAAEVAHLSQRVSDIETNVSTTACAPSDASTVASEPPAAPSSSLAAATTPAAKKKASKGVGAASPTPSSTLLVAPSTASTTPPPASSSFCSQSEAASLRGSIQQLQTLIKQLQSEHKAEGAALRESVLLSETLAQAAREETRALARTSAGLKQLVEKLVRDTGAAEELLQQYVSTITHQVASVTRQYVSVRIRDNNRLIDATLRARVPAYAANESERFLLVRPESGKSGAAADDGNGVVPGDESGVVLHEDDADGMRQFVMATMAAAASSAK